MVVQDEPNNHLYSLGKFVHIGLRSRCIQNQSSESSIGPEPSSSPYSNMFTMPLPLPPRHKTMSASTTSLANRSLENRDGSAFGNNDTSPLLTAHGIDETTSLPPRSNTITIPLRNSKTKLLVSKAKSNTTVSN